MIRTVRVSIAIVLALLGTAASAAPPTGLLLRGYSVIPAPREVRLSEGDIRFDAGWALDPGALPAADMAVRALRAGHEFAAVAVSGRRVRLRIAAGAVVTKAVPGIERQAYRLTIAADGIEIAANAAQGLFYGAQTLLQLRRSDGAGRMWIPAGVVEDWPDRELRFLHWDTKHHQDRMATLKRYLDWSARLKVNMIGFELEDKFAYPSHPVIGAPGAFTPAELQEIVDYGLERFIQVVPIVQSPAHLAYVLKHPKYAHLKADGNNYQSDLCDERTYDLIFSMYDDLIRATKGVDYFFVSTDEIYYAGIGSRCQAPYNPENRSLAWATFAKRAHDHLARQNRRMLAWLEYPLLAKHLEMIPPGVIDGVVGEDDFLAIEKRKGMRQLSYVSMQGAELHFPNHFSLDGVNSGNLETARASIASGRASQLNPIGVFGAAWGDSGLHSETFWLGWSAVAQWGWNIAGASVEQHTAEFMRFYYGSGAPDLTDAYRALQRQARAWEGSWDRVVSKARAPGYGNSHGKGVGTERQDLTLASLPRLPGEKVSSTFRESHARAIAEARRRGEENAALVQTLTGAILRVEQNRYNVEVFQVLARFIGHHWRLLAGLSDAEEMLDAAHADALRNKPAESVGRMLAAYDRVQALEREGREIFRELTAVFEKDRFPKNRTVNGRAFLHVLDDTKDHWADRRADLSYMSAPEESIGLTQWRKRLLDHIEAYARQNNVPVKALAERRLEE